MPTHTPGDYCCPRCTIGVLLGARRAQEREFADPTLQFIAAALINHWLDLAKASRPPDNVHQLRLVLVDQPDA